MKYTESQLYDIADKMQDQGGSFIRNIGGALRSADMKNKKRLVDAFPEYFEDYFLR